MCTVHGIEHYLGGALCSVRIGAKGDHPGRTPRSRNGCVQTLTILDENFRAELQASRSDTDHDRFPPLVISQAANYARVHKQTLGLCW